MPPNQLPALPYSPNINTLPLNFPPGTQLPPGLIPGITGQPQVPGQIPPSLLQQPGAQQQNPLTSLLIAYLMGGGANSLFGAGRAPAAAAPAVPAAPATVPKPATPASTPPGEKPGLWDSISSFFNGPKASGAQISPQTATDLGIPPDLSNILDASSGGASPNLNAPSPYSNSGLVSNALQTVGVGPETAGSIGDVAGVAGPALALWGAYNTLAHPSANPWSNAAQGGIEGFELGNSVLPGIGGVVGGVAGTGIGAASTLWHHKTTQQHQADADSALLGQNNPTVTSFINQRNAARPGTGNYRGKVDPTVPMNFVGVNPYTGQWVNNAFAAGGSKDPSLLKPEDIWGSDTFFEKYGNDWLGKFSEQQRRDIAQQALNAPGAVKLTFGAPQVDWNSFTPNTGGGSPSPSPTSNVNGQRIPLSNPSPSGHLDVKVSPGIYQDYQSGKTYYSTQGARR